MRPFSFGAPSGFAVTDLNFDFPLVMRFNVFLFIADMIRDTRFYVLSLS